MLRTIFDIEKIELVKKVILRFKAVFGQSNIKKIGQTFIYMIKSKNISLKGLKVMGHRSPKFGRCNEECGQ